MSMMDKYITIKLQVGDSKIIGINGCELSDVLLWCRDKVTSDNSLIPKDENSKIIKKIDDAIFWLNMRDQKVFSDMAK